MHPSPLRLLLRSAVLLLAALTVPSAVAADEAGAAGLRAQLIPAPRELSVTGVPGALPDEPWVLSGPSAAAKLAWNPAAVLNRALDGRALEVRLRPATSGESPWTVVLAAEGAAARWPRPWNETGRERPLPSEGYRLQTLPAGGDVIAVIEAGGGRGLLYGLQTLAQLLELTPGRLARVTITDGPEIGGIREVHVHGFDKGYGAGDFKGATAFTRDLPAILPFVSAGRYNLFRFSLDAAWINTADRWLAGEDVDALMRRAIELCRQHGVDALVEVRLEGQRAGSTEPDTYPLNPLTEWGYYEKALRRALSWRPDVLDFSLNDLQALNYPDVVAKYGGDGRYSGVLMAELLHKVKAVVDETAPGTRLHHLPRFYADVHWQRHPQAMPELWARAPQGVVMYTTSPLSHPVLQEMRQRHGGQFVYWVNYTSNHAKELKVMLDGPVPDLTGTRTLPAAARNVVINLGYPIAPQHPVVLAIGEMLWNPDAYRTWPALEKSARLAWGDEAARLLVRYGQQLDAETIMASRGVEVATLLRNRRRVSEDERAVLTHTTAPARDAATWGTYRERAVAAQRIAKALAAVAPNAEVKRVADVLYWNAKRTELDARAGALAVAGLGSGRLDRDAIAAIVREHETLIRDHYPVEPNDPKSAEVVNRGNRQIRDLLAAPARPATGSR